MAGSLLSGFKSANLGLAFLLELCMLGAVAWWGFSLKVPRLWQILAAIAAPVLIASIWGFWLAPKAERRLPLPWLDIAEIVLFALSALALWASGKRALAVTFAVLILINRVLLIVWR